MAKKPKMSDIIAHQKAHIEAEAARLRDARQMLELEASDNSRLRAGMAIVYPLCALFGAVAILEAVALVLR
jgi:ABC-type transporter Mla maintaining outer membrane lipid asymmetry ATPase subunit MlaF